MLLGMVLWLVAGVAVAEELEVDKAVEVQVQLDELRAVLARSEAALRVVDGTRACLERRRGELAQLVDMAEDQIAVLADPGVAPARRAHGVRVIALAHDRATHLGAEDVCGVRADPAQPTRRELSLTDGQPLRDDPLSLGFDGGRARVLKMSRVRAQR